jgi:hypothetical protein
MTERRIEVLYVDGCPNVNSAVGRAHAAIEVAGAAATVILVPVRNEDEARRLRFVGSPTVRVDGDDVEPTAVSCNDFGMQCRLYRVGGRLEGAPPVDWIVEALLEP